MKNPLGILGLLSSAISFLCCGSSAYAAAGATTPFTTYEAEAATLGGGASAVTYVPVATDPLSPEVESSGHAYARLTGTGQSMTWTNNTGQNITALNVRFCIPDAPTGGGTTGTLNLYVDGTMRQAVTFNSAQEWEYYGPGVNGHTSKIPGPGLYPHQFWDDKHFFITGAAVAPGSTIMFKQDAANTAAFYRIDCVDVENPPAPLTQPANSLSITSYGAVADNPSVNNYTAIQNCFNACQAQGKIAWIPSGTFYWSGTSEFSVTGITVQGAGMWHSVLFSNTPGGGYFACWSGATLKDFMIDTNAPGPAQGKGGINPKGDGWTIQRMWTKHVGGSIWAAGSNGLIDSCRINTSWGDGINLNLGLGNNAGYNLTVNNNFVRGTGDDGIAGGTTNAMLTNNTVVAPWWAGCMNIYNSIDILVSNNKVSDSGIGSALGMGVFGGGGVNQGALVVGNTVLRGGTVGGNNAMDCRDGSIQSAVIANNTVNNSVATSIGVGSCYGVAFVNNSINSPGLDGIGVDAGAVGNAMYCNNTVTNVPAGRSAIINNSNPSKFSWVPGKSASSYDGMSGVQTASCSEGGLYVGWLQNGDYTVYNNIDLTGMTVFQARVASWGSGGTITIHVDSPTGPVLGTVTAPLTGGIQNWAPVNYTLTGSASGTHNVYLVYATNGVMNIQWFDFKVNPGDTPIYFTMPRNGELINLVCKVSGKALDNGGSTADGSPIVQSTLIPGSARQQWKVVHVGGGYFNLICQASGKALDNGGSTSDGAGVRQWTPMANNPNQNWRFLTNDGRGALDYSKLICQASGKALDNDAATSDGAVVQQWAEVAFEIGQDWQKITAPQSGSIYHLVSKTSGKAMDNGNTTSAGAAVIQWDDQNSSNQEWQLVDVGGGYYNLICQKSGMALDNSNSTSSGTAPIQWSQQGGNINQKWQPVYVGGGYYNLVCQKSGMALDNVGSIANGTQLQQTTLQSGNTNQQWSFKFISAPQTKIGAASYSSASSGLQAESCSEGGQDVGYIVNGAYTVYNNVNMSGVTGFRARTASGGSGGSIVIHLDSLTGPVVGTATVPGTSGWQSWTTVSCNLTPSAGTHNLYLAYTGGGGYLFNVQWFELWWQLLH